MCQCINCQTKLDLRCDSVLSRVDFNADKSSFLRDSIAAATTAGDEDDDDDDATVGLWCRQVRQGNVSVTPTSSLINDCFKHTTTNHSNFTTSLTQKCNHAIYNLSVDLSRHLSFTRASIVKPMAVVSVGKYTNY